MGLTVFLGDLEPGCQVWVEVVLAVKGTPRVDVGSEGEAGEEGEPDGRGLQDLFARGGCSVPDSLEIPREQVEVGLAGNAPGNAASKGATCVLGGSSYVAVSAAQKGESSQRKQATSGVVQETGLRTGEEFRVPFELDVQFESHGGFPARPSRIRAIRRASRV